MSVWSRWTINPTQDRDRTAGPEHGLLLLGRESVTRLFMHWIWGFLLNHRGKKTKTVQTFVQPKCVCSVVSCQETLGTVTGGSGSLFESYKAAHSCNRTVREVNKKSDHWDNGNMETSDLHNNKADYTKYSICWTWQGMNPFCKVLVKGGEL